MKILILSIFFAITASTSQACKVMEYSVNSPTMKSFEENSAFKKSIEADVEKMLKIRGYTPKLEREQQHDYSADTYCLLQFTVHEWPNLLRPVDEVQSSVQIYYFSGGIGNLLFNFDGEYRYALGAIPKQK